MFAQALFSAAMLFSAMLRDFVRAVLGSQAHPAAHVQRHRHPSMPGELFAKFQTSFYADPVDAVFKALGVE